MFWTGARWHLPCLTWLLSQVTHVLCQNTTTSTPTNETTSIAAGLTSCFVFLGIFIIILIIKRRSRSDDDDSQVEIEELEDGSIGLKYQNAPPGGEKIYHGDNVTVTWVRSKNLIKVVRSRLVAYDRLSLLEVVGEGQFGCVYLGTLAKDVRHSNDYGSVSHEKVAVKTLKATQLDAELVEKFLQEGMIMKDFIHPHILNLLGVSFSEQGVPMIVLPFMANGNLKTYIEDPNHMLTVRQLLGFGRQICDGMVYLAQQKFVHRDLALRNCMLDDRFNVKIGDFGLSRDIYTKEYYASEDKKARLPVKWMALESLTKNVYTSKSDVWSYGIVLWELMTRGVTPYPDVANWDIRSYVQCGRRMARPDSCPDNVYQVMRKCWGHHPEDRPTFEELYADLSQILDDKYSRTTRRGMEDTYVNVHPEP